MSGPAGNGALVAHLLEHSVKIAALAAQHDKLRLSLKAFSEVLACGPPMEAFEANA